MPFDSKEGAVGFASYSRGINCNWHRSISGTSYGSKGFWTALPLCLLVSNYFVFLLFLLFLKGWHVAMITNHRVMSNAHLQSPCILSLTLSTRQFQQVEVMSTCHDLTTFSTPPSTSPSRHLDMFTKSCSVDSKIPEVLACVNSSLATLTSSYMPTCNFWQVEHAPMILLFMITACEGLRWLDSLWTRVLDNPPSTLLVVNSQL